MPPSASPAAAAVGVLAMRPELNAVEVSSSSGDSPARPVGLGVAAAAGVGHSKAPPSMVSSDENANDPPTDEASEATPAAGNTLLPESQPHQVPASSEKSNSVDFAAADSADPELARLKALHASRQSARRKPPTGSTRANFADGQFHGLNYLQTSESAGTTSDGDELAGSGMEDVVRRLSAEHAVELQSLRRNHIENLRKIVEERDMFAAQLAKEQASTNTSAATKKQISDLHAQLRAARIRTTDLHEELARLQDENKQMSFRLQANKTLGAAADSYSKVIEELVQVKVKCAQLEEEKEEYRRASKEVSSSIALLAEANGDLETSRAEWVVQCADLQRQVDELQNELANFKTQTSGSRRSSASSPNHRRKTDLSNASPASSLSGVPLD